MLKNVVNSDIKEFIKNRFLLFLTDTVIITEKYLVRLLQRMQRKHFHKNFKVFLTRGIHKVRTQVSGESESDQKGTAISLLTSLFC